MWGTNFGDGRGNVTLHGEYAHQDRVFASDVPFCSRSKASGSSTPTAPARRTAATAIPTRSTSATSPTATAAASARCSSRSRTPLRDAARPGGTAWNCLLVFDPASNLSPSTETARFSTGPIGGGVGGNLDNGREGQFYSVLPQQDRYNLNLLAHYEFAEALEAFVEAKWVRVDVQGSNSGAGGIQGSFTNFDRRERFRLDNPFLTPAQRTMIGNAILASGCNSVLTQSCATAIGTNPNPPAGVLTTQQRAAIAAGTYRFSLGRTEVAGTVRDEHFQRDTFRIVGGLRGNFWDDWSYEVSANYGRMEEDTTTSGFVDNQRLMLSLDAGLNPATGQIQCRSQFDPASAVAYDTGAYQTGGTTRCQRRASGPAGGRTSRPACRSIRSAKATTTRRRATTSTSPRATTRGPSSSCSRLRQRRFERVVRAARRPGQLRARRRVPQGGHLLQAGRLCRNARQHQQRRARHALRSRAVQGEGSLRRAADSDSSGYPVLRRADAERRGAPRRLPGRHRQRLAYNAGIDWGPVRDLRFRANSAARSGHRT
jgi:hypothetical protein